MPSELSMFNTRLVLLVLCTGLMLMLQSSPARAVNLWASWRAYTSCQGSDENCLEVAITADLGGGESPVTFTTYHADLAYDPQLWIFNPSHSGPLCSFAAGGTPCLPAVDVP